MNALAPGQISDFAQPSHDRCNLLNRSQHSRGLLSTKLLQPQEILRRGFIFALALFSATLLQAQSTPTAASSHPQPEIASHPDWPKANLADVASIESTVRAFFSAISVPAGGKIDLNRLRSLFVPGGRIVDMREQSSSHPADLYLFTPEEYAAMSDSQTVTDGFFDSNPANQVESFGVIAHVYATFESRSNPEDAKPFARGIKSFELLNSGGRWHIVQVYWDWERPDNPIPERYLHDSLR
jgi:hypothetical protein